MDKKEFKRIRSQVAKMNDEEKEELLACLSNEKENLVMQVIENILDLVSSNEELVEQYGVYIDEYYQLPMKNRRNVCKHSYKYFIKNGNYDINSISMLIAHEAENIEERVDPVIAAIRESRELMEKNPKINVEGIRTEDPIIAAIRENNSHYDERPKINFKGVKYDI